MRSILSLNERDRRWSAMQAAMRASNLDAIVVGQTDARGQKGAFRYLSDERPFHRFGYVVMPRDREPIAVLHPVLAYDMRGCWIADVRTPAEAGVELVAILREAGAVRVGVIGADHAFRRRDYAALAKAGVELVDCDALFETLRRIKSAEEIVALEEASTIADQCFALLLESARPGMREAELSGLLTSLALARGADELLFLTMSGTATDTGHRAVIRTPDQTPIPSGAPFIFSIELSGPSGFWVELARVLSFGASADAAEIAELATRSVSAARAVMRDGVSGAAIQAALESPFDPILYEVASGSGHAIGQDVIELPMIGRAAPDDLRFAEGMALAMHPMFHCRDRPVAGYVADTYVLERDHARVLSRWPLQLYRR